MKACVLPLDSQPKNYLGQLIESRMQELGWSNRYAAEKIGISHAYLGRIIRGEATNVGVERLTEIAQGLNIPLDELQRAAMGEPPILKDSKEADLLRRLRRLPREKQEIVLKGWLGLLQSLGEQE